MLQISLMLLRKTVLRKFFKRYNSTVKIKYEGVEYGTYIL